MLEGCQSTTLAPEPIKPQKPSNIDTKKNNI